MSRCQTPIQLRHGLSTTSPRAGTKRDRSVSATGSNASTRLREIEVDEALTVLAAAIEDWTEPRQGWEFTLHEGHDFDRANNVEGELLFASGEQSSSLRFRLEQLDRADEMDANEFLLVFEERDG